jgi:hypothetical protein
MWLLDWLVARYIQVQEWFGDAYRNTVNFIKSIPDTLDSIYSTMLYYYDLAVSTVSDYLNGFYDDYVAPVIARIQGYIDYAFEWLQGLQQAIDDWIAVISAFLDGIAQAIYDTIIAIYGQVIADITAAIDDIIYNRFPIIGDFIDFISQYTDWLAYAASNLNIDDLFNFWNEYNSIKDNLIAFCNNPLEYTKGVLEPYILAWLSFLIGYAMGTVKYDLPNAESNYKLSIELKNNKG